MIKERIPITGELKDKVQTLMKYAGWHEDRRVDISAAEQYYARRGMPMMKSTARFYRRYFGLCPQWYLEVKKTTHAADFWFALFPYMVDSIKDSFQDEMFASMAGEDLRIIESCAGMPCQPVGHIGYYYPAEVWISEHGKLLARWEYQDETEIFDSVFDLIERELRTCKFDSAAMKSLRAFDSRS